MQTICTSVIEVIALASFLCCAIIEHIVIACVNLACGHLDVWANVTRQIVFTIGELNVLVIKAKGGTAALCWGKCHDTEEVDAILDDVGVELTSCNLLDIFAHVVTTVTQWSHCKSVLSVNGKHCKLRQTSGQENPTGICATGDVIVDQRTCITFWWAVQTIDRIGAYFFIRFHISCELCNRIHDMSWTATRSPKFMLRFVCQRRAIAICYTCRFMSSINMHTDQFVVHIAPMDLILQWITIDDVRRCVLRPFMVANNATCITRSLVTQYCTVF